MSEVPLYDIRVLKLLLGSFYIELYNLKARDPQALRIAPPSGTSLGAELSVVFISWEADKV